MTSYYTSNARWSCEFDVLLPTLEERDVFEDFKKGYVDSSEIRERHSILDGDRQTWQTNLLQG